MSRAPSDAERARLRALIDDCQHPGEWAPLKLAGAVRALVPALLDDYERLRAFEAAVREAADYCYTQLRAENTAAVRTHAFNALRMGVGDALDTLQREREYGGG